MAKIMVVEDDVDQSQVLADLLGSDGHQVEEVTDGWDAVSRLKLYEYDLLILDWELPDVSGLQILKHYRAGGGDVPVLMLTARSDSRFKEQGLDLGSDDYVTKPYDARELCARVRALLRRPRAMRSPVIRLNNLELDPLARIVRRDGSMIHLNKQEFMLLEFFMRNPNRLFSADSLIDRVWHNDGTVSNDAVRASIKRLRQAIDANPENSMISTVHRTGYRFEAP